jgi:uncharacterized protein (TIGR02271 family)
MILMARLVPVEGKDWHGIVHRWPPGDDPNREISIRLDTGETLALPASLVSEQEDGGYRVALGLDEIRGGERGNAPLVIPVIHEELEIGKRRVEISAGIRVHKSAREEEQVVDLPLIHEQLEVERVPVDRPLDEPVPVRHVGETIIVPVMEEVLVVRKELRLVEELHIRRVRTEIRDPRTVMLRKEEATVERIADEEG